MSIGFATSVSFLIIVNICIVKLNKYIIMILNRYVIFNNNVIYQVIINYLKIYWLKIFHLKKFFKNQVTRFS